MRLKERPPGIEIGVLASNEIRDLRRRVADIAIRRARPDQPELIAKRVRRSSADFDAAISYLTGMADPKPPQTSWTPHSSALPHWSG